MPESSPFYPLLLKCGLKWFPITMFFPCTVGHDNQERSFPAPRDKIAKYRKPDS